MRTPGNPNLVKVQRRADAHSVAFHAYDYDLHISKPKISGSKSVSRDLAPILQTSPTVLAEKIAIFPPPCICTCVNICALLLWGCVLRKACVWSSRQKGAKWAVEDKIRKRRAVCKGMMMWEQYVRFWCAAIETLRRTDVSKLFDSHAPSRENVRITSYSHCKSNWAAVALRSLEQVHAKSPHNATGDKQYTFLRNKVSC